MPRILSALLLMASLAGGEAAAEAVDDPDNILAGPVSRLEHGLLRLERALEYDLSQEPPEQVTYGGSGQRDYRVNVELGPDQRAILIRTTVSALEYGQYALCMSVIRRIRSFMWRPPTDGTQGSAARYFADRAQLGKDQFDAVERELFARMLLLVTVTQHPVFGDHDSDIHCGESLVP